MYFINEIREMFVKLFVSADEISREKEMCNFDIFISSLNDVDVNFDFIKSSKRKNCVYGVLDGVLNDYCIINNISFDALNRTISLTTMLDVYNSCYFLYAEDRVNNMSLDKLLNGKLNYSKHMANMLISIDKEKLKSSLKIKDDEVLLKFITDLLLIRYVFKSNLTIFEFNKT
jgi:hypothetical protein